MIQGVLVMFSCYRLSGHHMLHAPVGKILVVAVLAMSPFLAVKAIFSTTVVHLVLMAPLFGMLYLWLLRFAGVNDQRDSTIFRSIKHANTATTRIFPSVPRTFLGPSFCSLFPCSFQAFSRNFCINSTSSCSGTFRRWKWWVSIAQPSR